MEYKINDNKCYATYETAVKKINPNYHILIKYLSLVKGLCIFIVTVRVIALYLVINIDLFLSSGFWTWGSDISAIWKLNQVILLQISLKKIQSHTLVCYIKLVIQILLLHQYWSSLQSKNCLVIQHLANPVYWAFQPLVSFSISYF